MLAVVIVGMAASGVLLPFASGAAVRAEGLHRTLAAKLANDLIEQIANTPFDDIVTNYNYTEQQGQISDATGAVFTDASYANFSRNVTCAYVYLPQQIDLRKALEISANCIRVTVAVSYRGTPIVSVNRLVAR
jgi:hypothetical protein